MRRPMTREVRFSRQAEDDPFEIGLWIALQADRNRARNYVGRIEAACRRLADFPGRGTPHQELGAEIRSMSFERRATICYRLAEKAVEILHVLHRGRDATLRFDATPR